MTRYRAGLHDGLQGRHPTSADYSYAAGYRAGLRMRRQRQSENTFAETGYDTLAEKWMDLGHPLDRLIDEYKRDGE